MTFNIIVLAKQVPDTRQRGKGCHEGPTEL